MIGSTARVGLMLGLVLLGVVVGLAVRVLAPGGPAAGVQPSGSAGRGAAHGQPAGHRATRTPHPDAPVPSPLASDITGGDRRSAGALAAADVSFRMAYGIAKSHGLSHLARCDLAGVLPVDAGRTPAASLEDALLVRVAASMLADRTQLPVSDSHVYIPATPGGTAKVEVNGAAVTVSFEPDGEGSRRLGELGLLDCAIAGIASETIVRGRVTGERGVYLYVASCQGRAVVEAAGTFVVSLALEPGEPCDLQVHEDRLGSPILRRSGPIVQVEGGSIPDEVMALAPLPGQAWTPVPPPPGIPGPAAD